MKGQRVIFRYAELIEAESFLCSGLAPEKDSARDFIFACAEFAGYLGGLTNAEFCRLVEYAVVKNSNLQRPYRSFVHILYVEAKRRGGRPPFPPDPSTDTRLNRVTAQLFADLHRSEMIEVE